NRYNGQNRHRNYEANDRYYEERYRTQYTSEQTREDILTGRDLNAPTSRFNLSRAPIIKHQGAPTSRFIPTREQSRSSHSLHMRYRSGQPPAAGSDGGGLVSDFK
ncbi:hypothetical protein A2U01_0063732, partial [Trifolium medium]|nr:hypothetical protein [Trifolium medium]